METYEGPIHVGMEFQRRPGLAEMAVRICGGTGNGSVCAIDQEDREELSWHVSTFRRSYRPVRPADDDDTEAWARFLPTAEMTDTGPKVFRTGQVWTSQWGVYRIDGGSRAGLHLVTTLARPQYMGAGAVADPLSTFACYSELLFDASAEAREMPPGVPVPAPNPGPAVDARVIPKGPWQDDASKARREAALSPLATFTLPGELTALARAGRRDWRKEPRQ